MSNVYSNVESFDGVGFKNVYINPDNNTVTLQGGLVCKFGVWYNADKKRRITASDGNKYGSGFHIFLSQKGAKNYSTDSVVKVSFKGAKVVGDQKGHIVIIADKMKFDEVL